MSRPKTLILTQADVCALLTMDRVVAAVEQALTAHGRGEALMPPKVYVPVADHDGDFRAMPAYLDDVIGVKWVSTYPFNPQRRGLPAVTGIYVLSDPATAQPLAIMDATLLTALRTGAAGAVASRHLAVGSPRTIGFIGCGVQARVLHEAHKVFFRNFQTRAADCDARAADRFAAEVGGRVVSIEEAASCDIVCTTTPSRRPIVQRAWVRAGTHINAMGADAPGKQELDPQILLDARVVVDDQAQAIDNGEINVAWCKGQLGERHLHGTLGQVVVGYRAGRERDEITVFDSTGIAIQDIAVARLVHELARERGVGIEVDFLA
jgi:alanine dehydrogenase